MATRLAAAVALLLISPAAGWPAGVQATTTAATRTFYFAEGYTGPGFTERLTIFMPIQSGTASISYMTNGGPRPPIQVAVQAGKPLVENVNSDVGPNQEVSAVVSLSGPGVVERTIHFTTPAWNGSTDKVGVDLSGDQYNPATEWNFPEGSTLAAFSEYLTLQNLSLAPNPVSLEYFTDAGVHPVKHLVLPPSSRTTVEVFSGDRQDSAACIPGTGGTCGVGRGIAGVSIRVTGAAALVAERPMYVNGYDFGSGPVRDGHDDFGAWYNGPSLFAEGTTLAGFYEYLTLENPETAAADVTLIYSDNSGRQTDRAITVGPQSRKTVEVFGSQEGVGRGVPGVSVEVVTPGHILAERPMYMVHDFGGGSVAGATIVNGFMPYGKLFEFAGGSTLAGEHDFLSIYNPQTVSNTYALAYYTTGSRIDRSIAVPARTRQTVALWDPSQGGAGPGYDVLAITASSTGSFLVERPSYSANPPTYGATDTWGYLACLSTTTLCSP